MILSYLHNLATDRYRGPLAAGIKFFLYLLSFIYGLIVRILIFASRIRPYRLNCKVVSVGNITLGGTGKTALVGLIAGYLKQKGHKVAVLSRGYKRKISDSKDSGDEPAMLEMNLKDTPVIVDVDRIRAAHKAIRDYAVDTVILDDGFQQWRIKKDLEIVTVDATCPFGNRNLIPRGILREPLSALRRADVFVLTKTNLSQDTQKIKYFLGFLNPRAPVVESAHNPVGFCKIGQPQVLLAPDILEAKTVTLFSGIGDHDSFENLIKNLKVKVGLSFRFRDHHDYTRKDLDNISRSSQAQDIDTLVTTEKDAVRLRGSDGLRSGLGILTEKAEVLFLRIELEITKDEEGFYNRLLGLYFS